MVKLVTGLIATLSALVLGLLIASAKSTFDDTDGGFRRSAAKIILLDRVLAQYGPESAALRERLRSDYAARIDQILPKSRFERSTLDAREGTQATEQVEYGVRMLSPGTESQRALQSHAAQLADEVAQMGWLAMERAGSSIPVSFLVVLTLWLVAMFASFALFAPRNATALTALLIGALSVSTAIFLIEEMNQPLDGFIRISSAPMRKALDLLGQ